MKVWYGIVSLLLVSTVNVTAVLAETLYVYPKAGQSQQQIDKDKYECHQWAKEQAGFDPTAASAAPPPPPVQTPRGGAVRGAARGALVGVAVGAIAGDAGKGAAVGAAGGGLTGGMRQRNQAKSQQQAQEKQAMQQAQQIQQGQSEYNRAYAVCLEGRSYSVK